MVIAHRPLAYRHWNALKAYFQPLNDGKLELDKFLKNWDVSCQELASIYNCSLTTANHWFFQREHRRIPTEKYKQQLALVHHIKVSPVLGVVMFVISVKSGFDSFSGKSMRAMVENHHSPDASLRWLKLQI